MMPKGFKAYGMGMSMSMGMALKCSDRLYISLFGFARNVNVA